MENKLNKRYTNMLKKMKNWNENLIQALKQNEENTQKLIEQQKLIEFRNQSIGT